MILELIHEKHKRSNGHCGLSIQELSRQSGISLAKVKEELRQLHKDGKIRVRDGAQGKLIFPTNE